MRVGLLTTAIFGDLSGYFFGNFLAVYYSLVVTCTTDAVFSEVHDH